MPFEVIKDSIPVANKAALDYFKIRLPASYEGKFEYVDHNAGK
jgi:hypothetical protein